MKIRAGFVSNSSSSSFIVQYPNGYVPQTIHQFKKVCSPKVEVFDEDMRNVVLNPECKYNPDISKEEFIHLFKCCDRLDFYAGFYDVVFLNCPYNPQKESKEVIDYNNYKYEEDYFEVIHKIILDCLYKEKMFLPDIYDKYINLSNCFMYTFDWQTHFYPEKGKELFNNALLAWF